MTRPPTTRLGWVVTFPEGPLTAISEVARDLRAPAVLEALTTPILRTPGKATRCGTVVGVDDEVLADAARGLRAIVDAVDRGELTAASLERIEGTVGVLTELSEAQGEG